LTKAAPQSVTQFKAKVVMNLVTPEAAVGVASEAGLLNKGSCLARDLGATNFFKMRYMIWSYFVVLLKSHLFVQQTHLVSGSTLP